MATWFGITTPVTEETLPADTRAGQQLYTVTNESGAVIRGDAMVVPEGDAKAEWFSVVNASRAYSVDGTEQVTLGIKVPDDVGAGTYSYRFRVVVGGGVPEEQFNDGPPSRITVPPTKIVPPPKPFPWWIVAVIAAIVLALVVGGLAVKACGGTPPPTPSPVPSASPTPIPTPVPTPTPDARPDLTLRVRASIGGLNRPIPILVDIRNEGAGDAGTFNVLVQAGGVREQFFTVSGLAAGQDFSKTVTMIVEFSSGTGFVTVDFNNTVDELDENNNSQQFDW